MPQQITILATYKGQMFLLKKVNFIPASNSEVMIKIFIFMN